MDAGVEPVRAEEDLVLDGRVAEMEQHLPSAALSGHVFGAVGGKIGSVAPEIFSM